MTRPAERVRVGEGWGGVVVRWGGVAARCRDVEADVVRGVLSAAEDNPRSEPKTGPGLFSTSPSAVRT